MMLSAVLCLAAAALFLIKLLWDHRRRCRIALPGPRGLPLLGNVLQIDGRRSYETYAKWSRIYGEAYRISIFGQPVIVLSSMETIREVLVERGQDFAGRPRQFFRAGFLADSYQDIVSGSPGPVWNALRKTVQREMKSIAKESCNGHRRLDCLTADILDDMMEELLAFHGEPIDPLPQVYDAVMNMTCLMLIGDRYQSDADELAMYKRLERLVTTSMRVGGKGVELDILPWLRFFGNSTYRSLCEAKRLRDVLYDRIKDRIEDDRTRGDGGAVVRGLAHALVAALDGDGDRKQNSALTSNNVKLSIVNLLIGGASSSTNYVYLLMNILAQNPDVQEKLRAEVMRVVGSDRRPTVADRASMPYATATVLELLRYGSLSPIVIPHQTVRDTRIRDVEVPGGVWIFMHLRRVHHDEEFWGDPYRFRPDRFIDPESGQLVPPEHERRRHVLSFSGGPRACPGEAIALARLFLGAVIIVQRSVVLPDSVASQVSCDPRTFDPGLVLSPKNFRVCFVRRQLNAVFYPDTIGLGENTEVLGMDILGPATHRGPETENFSLRE